MAIVAADKLERRAERIESLLSARLFVEPQLANDRITFVSNLSGHLSLYAMDAPGGVPEPCSRRRSPSRTRTWSAANCSTCFRGSD